MCNDNRMIMKTKNVLLGMAAVCGCAFQAIACTGIALTAADGSYVQSRTIEWARGVLQSEYVVIPRGQRLRSFTPSGADGMVFTSKYGVVGLAVVQKEFIAEGINEAGLSHRVIVPAMIYVSSLRSAKPCVTLPIKSGMPAASS